MVFGVPVASLSWRAAVDSAGSPKKKTAKSVPYEMEVLLCCNGECAS